MHACFRKRGLYFRTLILFISGGRNFLYLNLLFSKISEKKTFKSTEILTKNVMNIDTRGCRLLK